jgi:ketosteroid isomerase-like protein
MHDLSVPMLRSTFLRCALPVAAALCALASASTPAEAQRTALPDSAAVSSVITRYHQALESGDSATALTLLASDAVILESGGVETREEYRSHHLPADIAFASAVKSVRTPASIVVRGDVAWAAATSTVQGEFRGRAINSMGAELMVLTRTAEGWKITAIHWSSRNRRS